jgi:hypothetical protein
VIGSELDDLSYTITKWSVGKSNNKPVEQPGSPTWLWAIDSKTGQVTVNMGPNPDSLEWANEADMDLPKRFKEPTSSPTHLIWESTSVLGSVSAARTAKILRQFLRECNAR